MHGCQVPTLRPLTHKVLFYNFIALIYLCVCWHMLVEVRGQLTRKSLLSYQRVGPRDGTWVIRVAEYWP